MDQAEQSGRCEHNHKNRSLRRLQIANEECLNEELLEKPPDGIEKKERNHVQVQAHPALPPQKQQKCDDTSQQNDERGQRRRTQVLFAKSPFLQDRSITADAKPEINAPSGT